MSITPTEPDKEDSDLTTKEVAELLHVAASTVVRYANQGLFGEHGVFRLPSGHRRYRRAAVEALKAPEVPQ